MHAQVVAIVHVDEVRRGAGQEGGYDAMALPLALQVLIPLLISDFLGPDLWVESLRGLGRNCRFELKTKVPWVFVLRKQKRKRKRDEFRSKIIFVKAWTRICSGAYSFNPCFGSESNNMISTTVCNSGGETTP